MTKTDVDKKLRLLREVILDRLGQNKREIIENVRNSTPKGGEQEGVFSKTYLAPLFRDLFKEDNCVVEGIDSRGLTQFKSAFFNAKPAPDFIVIKLGIVGEIKYEKLMPRLLATAIGQALLYMESSKQEKPSFPYGMVIYFAVQPDITQLRPSEEAFINSLWEKHNMFIIIV